MIDAERPQCGTESRERAPELPQFSKSRLRPTNLLLEAAAQYSTGALQPLDRGEQRRDGLVMGQMFGRVRELFRRFVRCEDDDILGIEVGILSRSFESCVVGKQESALAVVWAYRVIDDSFPDHRPGRVRRGRLVAVLDSMAAAGHPADTDKHATPLLSVRNFLRIEEGERALGFDG